MRKNGLILRKNISDVMCASSDSLLRLGFLMPRSMLPMYAIEVRQAATDSVSTSIIGISVRDMTSVDEAMRKNTFLGLDECNDPYVCIHIGVLIFTENISNNTDYVIWTVFCRLFWILFDAIYGYSINVTNT